MSIVSHETFASLYADLAKSPFGTGSLSEQGVVIASVYHDFRSSNRPKDNGTLLLEVEGLFQVPRIPGALIMFVRQTGSVTGQLQVVHGFWK